MIAAVALLLLALAVSQVATRRLPGAAWTRRAPRLGVLVWQSSSVSVVASLVLAGVALALPVIPDAVDDVAGLLGACTVLLREHYNAPGGVQVEMLGALIAGGLLARFGFSLLREGRTATSQRRRQRAGVSLVGHAGVVPGTLVVEDSRPAVFCIPGIRPRVVLTTGALEVLTPRQRVLTLSHEQAHLKGRHDLPLTLARGLQRAFPFVSLFGVAAKEIGTLLEMVADDRAARGDDRLELAAALIRLAQGPQTAGTMAANGGAAVERVQRLLAGSPRLPDPSRWWIAAGAAVLAVAPLFLAAAPALESALLDYCSITLHA